MNNRYTYNETLKTTVGRTYLSSTIYPRIKPSDNDLYIISQAGDRLDLLANKYYNEPSLWWVISVANNINDASFYVQEGIQLRIPNDLSRILSDFKKSGDLTSTPSKVSPHFFISVSTMNLALSSELSHFPVMPKP